jgi:hypothetical protein
MEQLIEQLEGLPRGDREAILARFDTAERRRLMLHVRSRSAAPASPYSPDIAERIAAAATGDAKDSGMTRAGRAALLAANATLGTPVPGVAAGSLVDTLVQRLARIGRPA